MENALERLIKRITAKNEQKMEMWQWGQGVVLFSLTEAYKKTGKREYIEFIKKWVDEHLAKETPGFSVNTTAPLLGVLYLYEESKEQRYIDLCKIFAEFLISQNPRCEKGGFEHTCTGNNCPNQMWIDTLFMCGLFLVKYGLLTGEKMYINEALRQFVVHYDFLGDSVTGLVYHGYYSDDRTQRGVLWGRGNAWFSAASAIVLGLLDESYPLYNKVKENFINHTMGAIGYQRSNGGWNTVINDDHSYFETTGTSGLTYGLIKGIEMGFIEEKYIPHAKLALNCLVENVDANGVMTNASTGTCVMDSKDDYNNVPKRFEEFSQGLAILALSVDNKWYK